MGYPRLVRIAKTPVHVELFSAECNEYGERETAVDGDFFCNRQSGGEITYGEQRQRIQLSGTLLFDGDICPDCDNPVDGKVKLGETEFRAVRIQKHRNPDGTVNYTRIDVI